MIFKKEIKKQNGNLFLLVTILLLISTYLLNLIFKIDKTSTKLVLNIKNEENYYNTFLSPKSSINDNLVFYPKNPTSLFDFNNLLKSSKSCKDKNTSVYNKIFTTFNFCNEKEIKYSAYLGAIIARNDLILENEILCTSGDIFIPYSLTLTKENTYILSLSSIEIQNIIGEDNSKTYNLFIFSGTKDIKISTSTNVKTYDIPKSKFLTFSSNVFGLNFEF